MAGASARNCECEDGQNCSDNHRLLHGAASPVHQFPNNLNRIVQGCFKFGHLQESQPILPHFLVVTRLKADCV